MKIYLPVKFLILVVLGGALIAACAPGEGPGSTGPGNGPGNGYGNGNINGGGSGVGDNAPGEGTTMLWVDGSVLIYHNGIWIDLSDINLYQFSMCVEAGHCEWPQGSEVSMGLGSAGELNGWESPRNPHMWDFWTASDQKQGAADYCSWAGARALTEAQAAEIKALPKMPGKDGCMPGYVKDVACIAKAKSKREEAACPCILNPLPETGASPIGGFVEIGPGFRCAVDAPNPFAPFCQTAAFYKDAPPQTMEYQITPRGQFCQNKMGFFTADIDLGGGIIKSINGDGSSTCEQVDADTLVCYGSPGSQARGIVNLVTPTLLPDFACPAGSISVLAACLSRGLPAPNSPGQCMDGFEWDGSHNCCLSKLPDGAYPGCPPGVVIDPATGGCDYNDMWQLDGTVLHSVSFNLRLPECSTGGGETGEGVCPERQTLVCRDPRNPNSCYCK